MRTRKQENKKTTHFSLSRIEHFDGMSMMIPESVIQYEVFSFVNPKDYLSLLLSCSTFHHWLQNNNCFKYSMLLKKRTPNMPTYKLRISRVKIFEDFHLLPSYEFLQSRSAQTIQTIFNYNSVFDGILPSYVYTRYEERICRELMKLIRFDINDLKDVPWFQHELQDLKTFVTTNDPRMRMELMNLYYSYLVKAVEKYDDLNNICVQHFRDIQDRDILISVLKHAFFSDRPGSLIPLLPLQFQKDKEVIKCALSLSTIPDLYAVSEQVRNDKQVVITAVSRTPESLQFASEELRRDRDVCLASINTKFEHNCEGLEWELCGLRDDKDLILKLVKYKYRAFELASDRLKSDRHVLLQAIRYGPTRCLSTAPTALLQDPEFVMDCVRRNGESLQYFSQVFKSNKEIVSIAVNRSYGALKYACDELKDDLEFIKSLNNVSVIPYTSERLRSNREFVLSALQRQLSSGKPYQLNFGYVVESLSNELRDDEEVMMLAVSIDEKCLKYCSEKIQNNRELVVKAILNSPSAGN